MNSLLGPNIGRGDTVFISTYGCQMNEHDTERMYSLLENHNFIQASHAEDADVIIINSCSVREKPVHKVMSEIGTYRPLKQKKPKLKIGVAGCVGQQEGKQLLKKNPLIDFVLGTGAIDILPDILHQVRDERKRSAWTQIDHRGPYSINTLIRNPRVSSFVNITLGCDNFCSFCIVPFTRGREKSRPFSELLGDVRQLVGRGVKEVTLLGQNVNSYKSPDGSGGFPDLLRAVCAETDIQRVRYTTSHPKDFNNEVLNVMIKYQNKLGDFLHLPAQSGSSKILESMNRGYTREEYLEKVQAVKAANGEMALSTDIIVGFPGETEEDFDQTLSLLAEIKYENVYAFKYSPRPFTKALKLSDPVPEEVKDRRLQKLIEFQDSLAPEICAKYEGRVLDVLVEGPSRTNSKVLTGRTTHNKVVNFLGASDLVGKILPLKIKHAAPFALKGEVIA